MDLADWLGILAILVLGIAVIAVVLVDVMIEVGESEDHDRTNGRHE